MQTKDSSVTPFLNTGYIGIRDLAKYLSISPISLRRWSASGDFPAPAQRVGKRRERKWLRSEIETWLIQNATK